MFAAGIFVGPVHHTTLVVPFVFTIEPNVVSFSQRVDPRREIDIVRDQDHIPAVDFDQEALVPATFVVVRKEFDNLSLAGDLHIAFLAGDYPMKLGVFQGIWR